MVSYNEGRHLRDCLQALTFCSEIVIVDLGSTDDTLDIALEMGAIVLQREWVPYAPLVRGDGLEAATNEWVVSIDPDMVMPEGADRLAGELINSKQEIGMITMSYQNYFGGRPVRYGRWGGVLPFFPTFVNKGRVFVETREHRGHFRLRPGYSSVAIPGEQGLVLRHNWVESMAELKSKLDRYIPGEIEARAHECRSVSLPSVAVRILRGVIETLLLRKGVLEGFLGLRLAMANAQYEWTVWRGVARRRDDQTAGKSG